MTPSRRLLVGSALTNLGDGLLLVIIPLLLAAQIDTVSGLAFSIGLTWAPVAAVGWIAGRAFDSWPSRNVLWLAQVTRGLAVAGLVVGYRGDAAAVAALVAAGALVNSGEWVVDNGLEVVIGRISKESELAGLAGNMRATELATNRLIGPVLGGVLLSLSPTIALAFAALCFVGSVVIVPATTGDLRPNAGVDSVRSSVRRLLGFADTTAALVVVATLAISGGLTLGVLPRFAEVVLGLNEASYGVLIASASVGGVAGAALLSKLQLPITNSAKLMVGVFMTGAAQGLFAFSNNLATACLASMLYGLIAGWMAGFVLAIRQGESPPELRGLVGGIARSVSAGCLAVAAIGGGLLAGVTELRSPWLLALGVHLMAVIALWTVKRKYPSPRRPSQAVVLPLTE